MTRRALVGMAVMPEGQWNGFVAYWYSGEREFDCGWVVNGNVWWDQNVR